MGCAVEMVARRNVREVVFMMGEMKKYHRGGFSSQVVATDPPMRRGRGAPLLSWTEVEMALEIPSIPVDAGGS